MKEQTFKVESGALRVTDPCYEMDTLCAGTLENVKNGTWFAHAKYGDQGRVASLNIRHADYGDPTYVGTWDKTDIDVGVDSGQAGFFDLTQYADAVSDKGNWIQQGPKFLEFYDKVCGLTIKQSSTDQFGVVPFGVVSSTGWGDGSYHCYVLRDKDNGLLVAAQIVFLGGEDEDDEDEENYDYEDDEEENK